MNDVEFFGRVAQKPAKVNEDSHPFYTGRWNRTPEAKAAPVVLEETRVRDEDLPPDEFI